MTCYHSKQNAAAQNIIDTVGKKIVIGVKQNAAAQNIIDTVGKKIVIGVALGLGKPIGLLNALYRMALQDPSIHLTIITGLTLARPTLHHDLEKRLVEPILDRMMGDYEDPLYERARVEQSLPDNIRVMEFYLSPGKFLHNNYVQQNYISSNYTNVVRDLLHFSINVLAQQVARSKSNDKQYSLSSNSDLFLQMAKGLRQLEAQGKKIAIAAEVNLNLPFMHGDAIVEADAFTDILDTKKYPTLFALLREEISVEAHLIGLYTSTLVKDEGCLQIGIGKLGNALANALIMRHQQNDEYREILNKLRVQEKFGETGFLSPFENGLYASTEMLSDEYLHLYKANILKKRVYDHVGLQRLLNEKEIDENVTPNMIECLIKNNIIQSKFDKRRFFIFTKVWHFKA